MCFSLLFFLIIHDNIVWLCCYYRLRRRRVNVAMVTPLYTYWCCSTSKFVTPNGGIIPAKTRFLTSLYIYICKKMCNFWRCIPHCWGVLDLKYFICSVRPLMNSISAVEIMYIVLPQAPDSLQVGDKAVTNSNCCPAVFTSSIAPLSCWRRPLLALCHDSLH